VARYTEAFIAFRSRLIEVESLCFLASAKERKAAIENRKEINALCRGAIVLLSAHLEAFIKELGEVALNALHAKNISRESLDSVLFYHVSKDLLDEILNTRDPRKIADKIFSFVASDLPFWSRTGPFPQPVPAERFNKGFSNPAFEKVRAYFKRFGYLEYKDDLARALKADYAVTENMVDHLVDIRNKIAHGDPTATKTPYEVTEMIAIIRRYGKTTDSVFSLWCKKNYCRIK
jgi:hypothetical protein